MAPLSLGQNVRISSEEPMIENFDRHLYSEYYDSLNINETFYYIPNADIGFQTDYTKNIEIESEETNNLEKTTQSLDGPIDFVWPMYCHDIRNTGRSPYITGDNLGQEIWRFDIGDWCSGSPIIDDEGVIYIGNYEMVAVYPNGTLKWKYPVGTIVSAAAIDENGILYFGTLWSGTLYALYSTNGTVYWTHHIGNTWASPTVGPDGIIYVPATDNWNVLAFYPNGTLKWGFHANERVFSSPAIGEDGTIYCTSYAGYLYALYPNNGTIKWKFNAGPIRTSPCIADDGTIYTVSNNGFLHAVYPNGTLKWKTNVGGGTSPTIGQDGTIYAGWKKLYAISPTNGTIIWVYNPGPDRVIEFGTPCNSIDGTIYLGTGMRSDGELIAVNPDGTEKWRNRVANLALYSAPCIGSDGTVYIGSWMDGSNNEWGYLYAIGNNPNVPSEVEINGPTKGWPGLTYEYTFSATSPIGNDIYYVVDWDDTDVTGWLGPYSSGESITLSKRWTMQKNFIIKAQVKDTDDNYGPWTEFNVKIRARNRATNNMLLLRFLEQFPLLREVLSRLITN